MKNLELLAPAGSYESLVAAVENGADAVYLAGTSFGARSYADNFDRAKLADAVKFAHLRNVAVHVTVNTAVADSELDECADFLRYLASIKADAAIVQDLGVAALARTVAPTLPLHASTQMTVHNLDGVLELASLGFSRVVLARELSLKEIRYIAENSPVEIEIFAHGALCVCYSGQCLFSSLVGARSGNRGRCAQPCRLPYSLVDENGREYLNVQAGKYLLSPRDLKTVELLPEIFAAGVRSLKIEGRMKRPEYVAVVVSAYRKAIDLLYQHKENGTDYHVDAETSRNLAQVFNRDFTTAFLQPGGCSELLSDKRPNNRGVLVGRIAKADKNRSTVTLKLCEAVQKGDVLDFWLKVGGRKAVTLTEFFDAKGKSVDFAPAGTEITFEADTKGINANTRAFRVFDAALTETARKSFQSGAPVRRIFIDGCAKFRLGAKPELKLSVVGEENTAVTATADYLIPAAENRPLTEETAQKQLSRLGSSVYAFRSLEIEMTPNIMLPVSVINELRRNAVEELDGLRLKQYQFGVRSSEFGVLNRAESGLANALNEDEPKAKSEFSACHTGALNEIESQTMIEFRAVGERRAELNSNMGIGNPLIIVSTDTISGVNAAIKGGADAVLFGGDSYHGENIGLNEYRQAAAIVRKNKKKIYFNTPRICRERELTTLKVLWQNWFADTALMPDAVYVHNIGTLHILRELIDEYNAATELRTDFSLIAFNNLTLTALKKLGVKQATLSPELNLAQIEKICKVSPLPLEIIAHGRAELMISEFCIAGIFLGNGEKPCGELPQGEKVCSRPCRKNKFFLKDRQGEIFPLVQDQFCRQHLLNGKTLSLLPEIGKINGFNLAAVRLEGKSLSSNEIENIVKAYRRFIGNADMTPEEVEWCRNLEGKNVTRGHFFRGVM